LRKKIQYDVPANPGSTTIPVTIAAAVVKLHELRHHLIKGVFRIFIIVERVSGVLGSRVEIFRVLWKQERVVWGEKSRRYESMR